METHVFFFSLLLVFLSARICSEFAVRMGAPSVIGELFAGILIGPSLFGWVELNHMLHMMAEIGIILLLFEVGLQTDAKRLVHAGGRALLVAIGGFIGPFILGYVVAHYGFDLDILQSMFIGGTLTATSIGITVRVLNDIGQHDHSTSQIVLGAAVIDDVLGVVLLAVLYEFTLVETVSPVQAINVLFFITIFFFLAPLAAWLMTLLIKHFENQKHNPGLIPTMIISLVLFFAWLAHVVGAPELLGGFAAGLSLSRRFFLPFGMSLRNDPKFLRLIQKQMYPIIHLFTPIFFVVVGLSLNLQAIDWSSSFIWSFSLSMLVIAIVSKFLGTVFLNDSIVHRIAIGLAMVPRGEVGLVFTELGRVSGILNNDVYAGMIIVIAMTTLMSPFVLKWFHHRHVGMEVER